VEIFNFGCSKRLDKSVLRTHLKFVKCNGCIKRASKILLFLPAILLCGCVGIIFGIYVGCYSQIELNFADDKTLTTDKVTIQKEAEKTLVQLDFTLSTIEQSQFNFEEWVLIRANLSQTNCVAQWRLKGKRSFWYGDHNYNVEMFIQKDTLSFVIIGDEQGSQKEVKQIQAALTKMIGNEFPNIKVNVTFQTLRTAMPP
jgi:hypothetical protein